MSAFTDEELAYLRGERRLARLATVGADGTPHVVPVGWSLDAELDAIEIAGVVTLPVRRSFGTSSEAAAAQS